MANAVAAVMCAMKVCFEADTILAWVLCDYKPDFIFGADSGGRLWAAQGKADQAIANYQKSLRLRHDRVQRLLSQVQQLQRMDS